MMEMTDRIRTARGSEPFDYYAVTATGGGLALDYQARDGRHVFEDTTIVEVLDADDQPGRDYPAANRKEPNYSALRLDSVS